LSRILVVEDDDQVRRFVVRVLERSSHEIFQASSAGEALEAGSFDLMIVDVGLPDMSGAELVRQHWLHAGRPSQVLFMTGYGEHDAAHLPTGASVLRKPFGVDALVGAVQALVG